MKKSRQETKKFVKLETTLLLSFITLVIGFVGGVVFSAYKMETTIHSHPSTNLASPDATFEQPFLTAEQEEELRQLEKAAADSPDNPLMWISVGNACFDFNLPEKAIQAYQTALELQPENANVWTDLGIMYRRIGDSEKAVAIFEKAQKIHPGHEMSLLNIGIVRLHDLNDQEGALNAWEKLLQINPDATTAGGMPIRDFVGALKDQ
jgi:tetratricopeptide (TPR) repeat protein